MESILGSGEVLILNPNRWLARELPSVNTRLMEKQPEVFMKLLAVMNIMR